MGEVSINKSKKVTYQRLRKTESTPYVKKKGHRKGDWRSFVIDGLCFVFSEKKGEYVLLYGGSQWLKRQKGGQQGWSRCNQTLERVKRFIKFLQSLGNFIRQDIPCELFKGTLCHEQIKTQGISENVLGISEYVIFWGFPR
ncbi:hypothetical protein KP509_21G012000 [Ceratopteris richardii]|uniref:Uncharacterized protein n=1 Tax=Ceratopteris richardii TaxID=49495 RepID=A0A8T2SAL1_CERRI|nr:hypothetical protein KP509_21G012000 [Ceratopteris richardii]